MYNRDHPDSPLSEPESLLERQNRLDRERSQAGTSSQIAPRAEPEAELAPNTVDREMGTAQGSEIGAYCVQSGELMSCTELDALLAEQDRLREQLELDMEAAFSCAEPPYPSSSGVGLFGDLPVSTEAGRVMEPERTALPERPVASAHVEDTELEVVEMEVDEGEERWIEPVLPKRRCIRDVGLQTLIRVFPHSQPNTEAPPSPHAQPEVLGTSATADIPETVLGPAASGSAGAPVLPTLGWLGTEDTAATELAEELTRGARTPEGLFDFGALEAQEERVERKVSGSEEAVATPLIPTELLEPGAQSQGGPGSTEPAPRAPDESMTVDAEGVGPAAEGG